MERKPFLPLSSWINRHSSIPVRFYDGDHIDIPNKDWGVFIGLEEVSLLHKANSLSWQGLKDSWNKTQHYLEDASEIINGLEGGWLDSEEREMIISEIGLPPNPCLPIYIITTTYNNVETVQYVGKTQNTNRFKGGHSISLKLHNPLYEGHIKRIYLCSVWFYFNDEYIALEWIKPEETALNLLDIIESNIIYGLKPHLNVQKKNTPPQIGFNIHIQNFCDTKVLNDEFVFN